ncbi:conserved hypothetical protein [uncultured Desulfovibrio sp.]|uniref:Uncharacterized protein n=3 Tax=Desulfovibrio TaxID=872 RepID=A0A212KXZ7_9BACT|nr:conserved hypothetical protein [uncultured Desulfovibrio sp.]VZH35429.1 conserved protein of unknown function [Desulfovibrio sp. 86]
MSHYRATTQSAAALSANGSSGPAFPRSHRGFTGSASACSSGRNAGRPPVQPIPYVPQRAALTFLYPLSLPIGHNSLIFLFHHIWGRTGFDGDVEALAAGRGAAGLVKSGTKVIANNDYDYAYAA